MYILWLHVPDDRSIAVGRLGRVELRAGVYGYVGSARGPGGLEARLSRHHATSKARLWHIDYLRPACRWLEVWLGENPAACECDWAQAVGRIAGAGVPVRGFGSSDCRCASHLFRFLALPELGSLAGSLGSGVERVEGPWTRH